MGSNLTIKEMSEKPKSVSLAWNLAFAAASGSGATCVVQPMDLVKNRMQTNKNLTVSTCVRSIVAEKGITGVWTGLGAGLLRQCSYTTVRLGVYRKLEERFTPKSFGEKLGLGATAGFIGPLFGNPAEVCLIGMEEGIKLHFVAAMISGLVTTIASMPVDIVKTRLQNQEYTNGVPEYKGVVDVFGRVVKNEGVLGLWKGFFPYYFRLGPHTVLTFILVEKCREAYLAKE